jgi:uncharacterized protein (TIGR04255 family)
MSLYPYAGAHAVQSAAFALEWSGELTDAEVSAISGLQEKLKSSLPLMNPIQTIMFQMMGAVPPVSAPSITGYVFNRLNQASQAGPARALEISRSRIVGQINDYTRWDPVWKEVRSWFETVVPIIGSRKITNIGLQYNDVFHWRDSPQNLDLKQVFQEDSVFIPANAFILKGLWHSHHGYFIDRTEPTKHRLLENVNVNVIEELGQVSFVISTVHKAEVPDIWGWDGLQKIVDSLMNDLHKRNKETLRKLLANEVAQKINLIESENNA